MNDIEEGVFMVSALRNSGMLEDLDAKGIKYQIIRGRVVTNMAPLANPNHGRISNKINIRFSNYLEGKQCTVYHDNNYLLLDVIQKNKI